MSTSQSRQRREPLSPQTILARIFVVVITIAMFVALVLPWLFT